MSRPVQVLVSALFLLSGATALAYQITWVRNLTLIFGATHQATSIVLASFMGGLCLGGFAFGRASGHISRPLQTYAFLEIGIGVYALVLPSLLGWADAVYVAAALAAEGITPGLSALRLVMGSAILLPPTFLMGATLPLLVSALVRQHSDFGARLSWLYGVNTLGAVIGAVVTGFVLISALGVWHTQVAAAVVNFAIGIAALAIDRWIRAEDTRSAAPGTEPESAPPVQPSQAPTQAPPQRIAAQLAYRGAAVCGMSALALEVMWTRALSLSLGTTTYSFTVMLAAFLTGIWLGSWLHAALPARRMPAARQLGFVMLAIGVASLVASYWIPRLPELTVQLNVALFGVSPRVQSLTILLAGFAVMLVPSIFMGISFPLTGEARLSLGPAFGRAAGDTIGWNTLGSIVGSLLAGFVLIPSLGLQHGMILAASLNVAYGCLILFAPVVAARERSRVAAAGALAAAVAALLLAPQLLPSWDLRSLGSFQNNALNHYVDYRGEVNVRDKLDEAVVRFYQEGRGSTVSVVDLAGTFGLLVNGKAVASDNLRDAEILLMLGHAPMLFHPDPKKALVVGLGTGFTAASLTAYSSLTEITLVEIEPAVIAAQPNFAAGNFDPFSDPRLTVEVQDGRNYLKTTSERFDVITADPIHPWNQGSGYLYTKEYYTIAKQRLTENGITCQWLPLYGLSIENYKSIVATFASVFPETTVWQMGIDGFMVGSMAPLEVDIEVLQRRLSEPTVEEQLRLIGVADAPAFLAELALDPAAVREYASGGIINTDDNLYLEFAAPISLGTNEAEENRAILNEYRDRPVQDSLFRDLSPSDREALERARHAKRATLEPIFSGPPSAEKIDRAREIVEGAPGYRPAEIVLSSALIELAQVKLQRGPPGLTLPLLREAVELTPEDAHSRRALGTALVRSGRYREAIEQLERSLVLRPNRWMTLTDLGSAQLGARQTSAALRSLRAAVALNPNYPPLNAELARLGETGRASPGG
jgi:spermidine synthase